MKETELVLGFCRRVLSSIRGNRRGWDGCCSIEGTTFVAEGDHFSIREMGGEEKTWPTGRVDVGGGNLNIFFIHVQVVE